MAFRATAGGPLQLMRTPIVLPHLLRDQELRGRGWPIGQVSLRCLEKMAARGTSFADMNKEA